MKSSANKKLERYRATFFLVGLVLALFAALTTLEYQAQSTLAYKGPALPLEEDTILIIPNTHIQDPKPPQRQFSEASDLDEIVKPNPTNFKIVFDGVDIRSDEFTSGDEEIPLIEGEELLDSIPVEDFMMDRYPIFSGCESLKDNLERQRCLVRGIHEKVRDQLRVSSSTIQTSGRVRMLVEFVIKTDGSTEVVDISYAPNMDVEMQVKRIIEGLPEFVPGLYQGRERSTKMSLPILIVLN
ncbi:MAG: hypothetical protein EP346_11910 [Bacteroidetes bacterium]|nr:MAG: hypothetical protein EP346_11910 [Bacteroidota bacterium]